MLTLSPLALAQPSEKEMQRMMESMMQGAEKMQSCFENIDESAIEQLQKRGETLEAEVKRLCAAGNSAAAEKKAMSFAKAVRDNKELAQLRKCGEMAQSMLPKMPFAHLPESDESNDSANNTICSGFK